MSDTVSQILPDFVKEIGSSGIVVSRDGSLILNKLTNQVLPVKKFTNYLQLTNPVTIGPKKFQYVHELVVAAWDPISYWHKTRPQVHHCDQNPLNNNIDNLIVLEGGLHKKLHAHIGPYPVSKTLVAELVRNLSKDDVWAWFDSKIVDPKNTPNLSDNI